MRRIWPATRLALPVRRESAVQRLAYSREGASHRSLNAPTVVGPGDDLSRGGGHRQGILQRAQLEALCADVLFELEQLVGDGGGDSCPRPSPTVHNGSMKS